MYKVGNFEFESLEEARAARKEAEGIKYIKARANMEDPKQVLELYNRLIEKEVFSTPPGYAFLNELLGYLSMAPGIRSEDILPVSSRTWKEAGEAEKPKNVEKKPSAGKQKPAGRRERDYRIPFMVSTFIAVVCALALAGVFVITALSGDNVNILNYENAIIDKYEAWERDLTERENALRERELKKETVEADE